MDPRDERMIREERQRRAMERKRRKKKQQMQSMMILGVFFLILILVLVLALKGCGGKKSTTADKNTEESSVMEDLQEESEETESGDGSTVEESSETTPEPPVDAKADTLTEAKRMAAMYDYDGAIALVQTLQGYENDSELTAAIDEFTKAKEACKPYESMDTITHIFFHTMIVDPTLAFDGDERSRSYNEVCNTTEEFKKIVQKLYDGGYVLINIYDIAHIEKDANGNETMVPSEILLPEGKKPIVISQDVSYYHYQESDGYCERLEVDENGKIVCKYTDQQGNTTYGNYDLVTIIDEFVEEHPDFSYHGAKGILGLTGYETVFGYKVNPAYKTGEGGDADMMKWLSEHPDFDYEKECEDCKNFIDALKAEGWVMSSHSYAHKSYEAASYDEMVADHEKWKETVEPFLGPVDILLLPYGADIGDWHMYDTSNDKYQYLWGQGFRYFCNVDSNQYWIQIGDQYMRQGRRNLDGYRMWEQISTGVDRMSDLFDPSEVFDPARPTPVER